MRWEAFELSPTNQPANQEFTARNLHQMSRIVMAALKAYHQPQLSSQQLPRTTLCQTTREFPFVQPAGA